MVRGWSVMVRDGQLWLGMVSYGYGQLRLGMVSCGYDQFL